MSLICICIVMINNLLLVIWSESTQCVWAINKSKLFKLFIPTLMFVNSYSDHWTCYLDYEKYFRVK